MSSPLTYGTTKTSWQKRLEEHCKEYQHSRPVFQIVSDRRGGRTAWSSIVTIDGTALPARYWYDGKNLDNAKEDAAECAIKWLYSSSNSSNFGPTQPFQTQHHGQVWQINQ